jgi:hypothetical protein
MAKDPLELEPADGFEQPDDRRPKMDEPLPVRLVAIADVRLPALLELERKHDEFYCGLLKMVRDEPRSQRIYRTDNHRIVFELFEHLIERTECRPLNVEIDSLSSLQASLIEQKIEFELVRDITLGIQSLALRDPSGNWLQIAQSTPVA